MSESEALGTIYTFAMWVGVFILLPFAWKFFYALGFYIAGRFKKEQIFIIRHFHEGRLVSEKTINLSLKSPIIKQLENAGGEFK
ncbi:hypothetical protein [Erwinia persicina]|uniref:Uncharacterized protein n=1 Tax=Erwinia persicina TaxID=55211 RepID=A0A4V5UB42_9GAMM|nr:hypothetical protein [Erwinia persicina]TKJ94807.1 hypothetical protein EpCFBP13511_00120 [Erwinia persicina]